MPVDDLTDARFFADEQIRILVDAINREFRRINMDSPFKDIDVSDGKGVNKEIKELLTNSKELNKIITQIKVNGSSVRDNTRRDRELGIVENRTSTLIKELNLLSKTFNDFQDAIENTINNIRYSQQSIRDSETGSYVNQGVEQDILLDGGVLGELPSEIGKEVGREVKGVLSEELGTFVGQNIFEEKTFNSVNSILSSNGVDLDKIISKNLGLEEFNFKDLVDRALYSTLLDWIGAGQGEATYSRFDNNNINYSKKRDNVYIPEDVLDKAIEDGLLREGGYYRNRNRLSSDYSLPYSEKRDNIYVSDDVIDEGIRQKQLRKSGDYYNKSDVTSSDYVIPNSDNRPMEGQGLLEQMERVATSYARLDEIAVLLNSVLGDGEVKIHNPFREWDAGGDIGAYSKNVDVFQYLFGENGFDTVISELKNLRPNLIRAINSTSDPKNVKGTGRLLEGDRQDLIDEITGKNNDNPIWNAKTGLGHIQKALSEGHWRSIVLPDGSFVGDRKESVENEDKGFFARGFASASPNYDLGYLFSSKITIPGGTTFDIPQSVRDNFRKNLVGEHISDLFGGIRQSEYNANRYNVTLPTGISMPLNADSNSRRWNPIIPPSEYTPSETKDTRARHITEIPTLKDLDGVDPNKYGEEMVEMMQRVFHRIASQYTSAIEEYITKWGNRKPLPNIERKDFVPVDDSEEVVSGNREYTKSLWGFSGGLGRNRYDYRPTITLPTGATIPLPSDEFDVSEYKPQKANVSRQYGDSVSVGMTGMRYNHEDETMLPDWVRNLPSSVVLPLDLLEAYSHGDNAKDSSDKDEGKDEAKDTSAYFEKESRVSETSSNILKDASVTRRSNCCEQLLKVLGTINEKINGVGESIAKALESHVYVFGNPSAVDILDNSRDAIANNESEANRKRNRESLDIFNMSPEEYLYEEWGLKGDGDVIIDDEDKWRDIRRRKDEELVEKIGNEKAKEHFSRVAKLRDEGIGKTLKDQVNYLINANPSYGYVGGTDRDIETVFGSPSFFPHFEEIPQYREKLAGLLKENPTEEVLQSIMAYDALLEKVRGRLQDLTYLRGEYKRIRGKIKEASGEEKEELIGYSKELEALISDARIENAPEGEDDALRILKNYIAVRKEALKKAGEKFPSSLRRRYEREIKEAEELINKINEGVVGDNLSPVPNATPMFSTFMPYMVKQANPKDKDINFDALSRDARDVYTRFKLGGSMDWWDRRMLGEIQKSKYQYDSILDLVPSDGLPSPGGFRDMSGLTGKDMTKWGEVIDMDVASRAWYEFKDNSEIREGNYRGIHEAMPNMSFIKDFFNGTLWNMPLFEFDEIMKEKGNWNIGFTPEGYSHFELMGGFKVNPTMMLSEFIQKILDNIDTHELQDNTRLWRSGKYSVNEEGFGTFMGSTATAFDREMAESFKRYGGEMMEILAPGGTLGSMDTILPGEFLLNSGHDFIEVGKNEFGEPILLLIKSIDEFRMSMEKAGFSNPQEYAKSLVYNENGEYVTKPYKPPNLMDTWQLRMDKYSDLETQIRQIQPQVTRLGVSQETIDTYNSLVERIKRVHEVLSEMGQKMTALTGSRDVGMAFDAMFKDLTEGYGNLILSVDALKERNRQLSQESKISLESMSKSNQRALESLFGGTVSFDKTGNAVSTLSNKTKVATSDFGQFTNKMERATRIADSMHGILTKLFSIVGTGNLMNDMITASSLRQTNQIMLASRRGQEEATKLYDRIQMLVVKLPGNDTFLTNILTMLGTMDKSLSASDLEYMGGVIADYYMGAQAKGQFNNETERELRNYLMTGQTRNLTNSIIASEIESLKGLNSVKERTVALEKALQKTGMDSIAHYDSYTNTFEEFKGRFQKSFADLGDFFLGFLQLLMKVFNKIDSLTGSAFSQATIVILGASALIVALTAGLGQLMGAVGNVSDGYRSMLKFLKDELPEGTDKYTRKIQELVRAIATKLGWQQVETASEVANADAKTANAVATDVETASEELNTWAKIKNFFANIEESLARFENASVTDWETLQLWLNAEAEEGSAIGKAWSAINSQWEAVSRWLNALAIDGETVSLGVYLKEKAIELWHDIIHFAIRLKDNAIRLVKIGLILAEAGALAILNGVLAITDVLLSPIGLIIIGIVAQLAIMITIIEKVGEAFGWWTDFGSMIEAISAGIGRIWDAFMNNEKVQYAMYVIGGFFENLQAWFGRGSVFGGLWEMIFGTNGSAGDWDILGDIINFLGAIGEALWEISNLDEIIEVFRAVGAYIGWVMSQWNKFVQTSEFQDLIEGFREIRVAFGELWEEFAPIFDELGQAWAELWDSGDYEPLKEDGNELLELFKSIAHFIRDYVIPFIKMLIPVIKVVLTPLMVTLKVITEIIKGAKWVMEHLGMQNDKKPTNIANQEGGYNAKLNQNYVGTYVKGKDLAKTYNNSSNNPTIINNNFGEGSVQTNAHNMTQKEVRQLFTSAFGYNKANGVKGVLR